MTNTITTPTRIDAPVMEAAGYVVAIDGLIWGKGVTKEQAIDDAVEWLGQDQPDGEIDRSTLIPMPATKAFLDGNAEHIRQIEGGVACTEAEAERVAEVRAERRAAWEAWIAEHRAGWPLPPYFTQARIDEDLYRDALVAMAWAYAEGKDRGSVRFSNRSGVPLWSEFAQRKGHSDGWLTARAADLGAEMAKNLGNWSFQARLIDVPRRRLEEIGIAIFGHEWIAPMSRRLRVDLRTAQRWAAGEFAVPQSVLAELIPDARDAADGLRRRLDRLEQVIDDIERAARKAIDAAFVGRAAVTQDEVDVLVENARDAGRSRVTVADARDLADNAWSDLVTAAANNLVKNGLAADDIAAALGCSADDIFPIPRGDLHLVEEVEAVAEYIEAYLGAMAARADAALNAAA
ncbi:hypothetical protein [Azospirillum argentinense]|uniref:Uncharacterized protein n=1 Tax=Azospirillum brasilense TaxID=192 RepID=A0A4D8QAR7_AZOBR|nr:hypothetical protein [Azospirillum argentinense]QCO07467.1 hypothetical protein D3867_36910 [Azospirillum argentinense]